MNKNIGKNTFRMFSRPTFIGGFTALVDFKELLTRYHTDDTEKIADQSSIASDWQAIGSDMSIAMKEYGAGK